MPTTTLNYTGALQTFVVPTGVTSITVDMAGAQGGKDATNGTVDGGKGGRVQVTLAVTPGDTLNVEVGGKGGDATSGSQGGGGYGGGGTGGHGAGGGGGWSRVLSSGLSATLAAAGGGGGSGGRSNSTNGAGGDAGGLTGSDGIVGVSSLSVIPGTGGTNTTGGSGGVSTGIIGGGGGGQLSTSGSARGGGAGGSGYYGGGGGEQAVNFTSFIGAGGGGGASYTNPTYASAVTHTGGHRTGDGYVTFTWTVPSIANCSTVTFTPGNTVGASHDQPAVYSSSASLDTGFGTNRTPAGWPATGALIKAVEVELTVTDEFTGDGEVQVGVFLPNDLLALPGATSDASAAFTGWTGEVREYVSGFADAYWLDKFGGWRTDYVSVGTGSASVNDLSVADNSSFHVGGIDLRARLRSADWDQSTSDRRTIASRWTGGGQGSWLWAMDGTNAYVRVARTGGGGSFDYQANCAISTLGLTDGQWADLRVTYDNTNRLRWYSGGTLVQTDTLSGMTTIESGTAPLRIGNNRNAGGQSAAGFNGDISFFEMRDSSGTVLQTLDLDRMSSSGDTAWTPAAGGDWYKGGGFTATGSTIPDTKRVRAVLEAPCPVNDFRLIVDAQTGALTVDEIMLEAACRAGRRGLGLIR